LPALASTTSLAFSQGDFAVLTIPGFQERMAALRAQLTPKLQAIGERLQPELEAATGRTFYVHVARHARRTKNPPDDTWVALSEMPRGYKMVPHFAVGLFADHLFVRVGALYETDARHGFAQALIDALPRLPKDAQILFDHQQPGGESAAALLAEPERIAGAARRRQGEVLLQRARTAETVIGQDVPELVRPLLAPLVAVYGAWRQTAQLP
jgi:uncharacterized protein YktB (UPF0637 family)